jgi:glycosyltransferase involved in cell wall biosynthesis
VGRLAFAKGQDMLLEAWPSVLKAVPNARLIFVGDGPTRQALVADHPIGADPSVIWAGHSEWPESYFAAADVMAVPSRAEGMALVPLEAMAYERSVVAFDAGGIRESIGDAGSVLACGDIVGLARALVNRLINPALARAEGLRGRQRVEEWFDARDSASRVAALVLQLADESTQKAAGR